MSSVINAYSQQQASKASANAKFALIIGVISAIIGSVTLGITAFSKGKNCALPDELCGYNPIVYMIIFAMIIIGALLHIISYGMSKKIKDNMSSEEIAEKSKPIEKMRIAGHVLLLPVYLTMIAIGFMVLSKMA